MRYYVRFVFGPFVVSYGLSCSTISYSLLKSWTLYQVLHILSKHNNNNKLCMWTTLLLLLFFFYPRWLEFYTKLIDICSHRINRFMFPSSVQCMTAKLNLFSFCFFKHVYGHKFQCFFFCVIKLFVWVLRVVSFFNYSFWFGIWCWLYFIVVFVYFVWVCICESICPSLSLPVFSFFVTVQVCVSN